MSRATSLHFVQFGAERVPLGLSLAGGPKRLYWEPLMGAVVHTEIGWVLLDTGMARSAHESEPITAAYRSGGADAENLHEAWHLYPAPPQPDAWNWGSGGDPLVSALATLGLAPADLVLAAVSHLHVDHSGGIPLLARAGVPVAIQRAELDFARSGRVGAAEGFHEPDWTEPGTDWRILDGDAELAPGVHAVSTPGHTPGHMSFRVDLPDTGTWLFAQDAADLAQNFLDRVRCGSCAGGTADDEARAEESFERLLSMAAETNARLIPGHDQIVLNAIRHPPGGHT